jgi:hypothetical protein
MIDAFPFYGLDDDVSIVPNTKEFLEYKMKRRMW